MPKSCVLDLQHYSDNDDNGAVDLRSPSPNSNEGKWAKPILATETIDDIMRFACLLDCILPEIEELRYGDIGHINALVDLISTGLPLLSIIFIGCTFSHFIATALRKTIFHFPTVTFMSCTFHDSDIISLLSYHPTLSTVHFGPGKPSRYLGHSGQTLQHLDVIPTRASDDAGSPVQTLSRFTYHIEFGRHFLFESEPFREFMAPRLHKLVELSLLSGDLQCCSTQPSSQPCSSVAIIRRV
ncbi:hypothetical protein ARMGADRAFT_1035324 [Armillaria gallica]|uniref:Uncharacterized protein n=1 Tax=Armillaria gallica TaxID=47427 RepID=A0A2H3CUL4_ARMGA|nr:hypothetical protein ARMGADRAFT_1035324 [Armillaria gallica]